MPAEIRPNLNRLIIVIKRKKNDIKMTGGKWPFVSQLLMVLLKRAV
ncbi:MAG: hypothetical protein JWP94_1662 [Mucilaginibacter sp.]|nr:hypothetical protein [Mucilaginibacter sp.]